MNTTLNPYLNFNGDCAEAMKFYQSVLGGELHITPTDQGDRTIHASLKSGAIFLMASDGQMGDPVVFGTSTHLSLNGDNEEEITSYFNGLAEGGKITMPLEKQFWGDKFGMLQDKFGIFWMVNISTPQV